MDLSAWTVPTGRVGGVVGSREKPALLPKEAKILAYIQAHQPVAISHLVLAFKANPQTMSVHMNNLRLKGYVTNDGRGRWAKWSVVVEAPRGTTSRRETPQGAAGVAASVTPVSIEQVSSVWHWAQRHARAA